MSKFDEYFKEVQCFTAGIYLVSGKYKKVIAHKMIEKEYGKKFDISKIENDRVRFGYPPDYVEDIDPKDGAVWYTGASGKGSKVVWIFRKFGN